MQPRRPRPDAAYTSPYNTLAANDKSLNRLLPVSALHVFFNPPVCPYHICPYHHIMPDIIVNDEFGLAFCRVHEMAFAKDTILEHLARDHGFEITPALLSWRERVSIRADLTGLARPPHGQPPIIGLKVYFAHRCIDCDFIALGLTDVVNHHRLVHRYGDTYVWVGAGYPVYVQTLDQSRTPSAYFQVDTRPEEQRRAVTFEQNDLKERAFWLYEACDNHPRPRIDPRRIRAAQIERARVAAASLPTPPPTPQILAVRLADDPAP